jgi:hypothetical protein
LAQLHTEKKGLVQDSLLLHVGHIFPQSDFEKGTAIALCDIIIPGIAEIGIITMSPRGIYKWRTLGQGHPLT